MRHWVENICPNPYCRLHAIVFSFHCYKPLVQMQLLFEAFPSKGLESNLILIRPAFINALSSLKLPLLANINEQLTIFHPHIHTNVASAAWHGFR